MQYTNYGKSIIGECGQPPIRHAKIYWAVGRHVWQRQQKIELNQLLVWILGKAPVPSIACLLFLKVRPCPLWSMIDA